jgi:S-adenosylmethionine:tRNA ribosyltransferase-isomerase
LPLRPLLHLCKMQISAHPGSLSIDLFNYHLPDEKVAAFPAPNREDAKLLVYRGGEISQSVYARIGDELPKGSLLVFNNSRVVEARLFFQKESGGIIEIFALEPHEQYADITTAMNQTGRILYKCLVGGASKWKHGMVLQKRVEHNTEGLVIEARIAERRPDCFVIELTWQPSGISFAQVLHLAGKIPIPPYLHREAEVSDNERYQTVYASADGSVAAPTAGLHFTPELLEKLRSEGIGEAFTTLHVGAGTFMPVKSETMEGHDMHAEFLEADEDLLHRLLQATTVIPVGTTAMRTLESLYWMGVKVFLNPEISLTELEMQQWEVYDSLLEKAIDAGKAIEALLGWMNKSGKKQIVAKTRIIIAPGYRFGICKGLITNFHQPKSTLLLLVSALIGEDWKKVYDYALSNDFRFLSYGDGSLLLPNENSR